MRCLCLCLSLCLKGADLDVVVAAVAAEGAHAALVEHAGLARAAGRRQRDGIMA